MTKLSDTQLIILSAVAQREGHVALPLPDSLRGGAANKVVNAMIRKGLIEEVEANIPNGDPVWRETGDGHGVTLVATAAGLSAIGIEPEGDDITPTSETDVAIATTEPTTTAEAEAEPAPTPPTARAGTKQARMIEMLKAEGGATIGEMAEALEWAPHTCRSALSGALKKRLGLNITSEKVEGRGRCYRIEPEAL